VLTTVRYFRDEYESHIKKLHCPAATCKGLVKAPCSHTCPAGVDVPRYIRLIAEEKYDEAVSVIRERIPFPSVCGYVCFHPCETKCRRGQIDEPIAIKALKRFAADHARRGPGADQKVAPPSGKRIAVVGSGPAGLTAAYYLAKCGGHAVTVFEALPQAGGMMRVGIPQYRLPRDILDAEIDFIRQAGVDLKTDTRIESLESLREQGFDAVFLALGAHAGVKMRVPGEDNPGVVDCVSLLRDVSLGKHLKLGKRVAVIGGGNAAIDAARTALRIGAKEVTALYRRTRKEMPADADEIEAALQEGVTIDYLVAPSMIKRDNSHLTMECVRMKLGEVDSSGRRRPEKIDGSEFNSEFDTIVAAIGQAPQIPQHIGIKTTKGGTLAADADTLATEIDGIFAGGDVVSGPASVIEAIAAGRQAAVSIDKYLGGQGIIDQSLAPSGELTAPPQRAQEEEEQHRSDMALLPAEKRIGSFDLVELGLSAEGAAREARRCLSCDLEED
jgi:NADH-quinone oxidoreductase subunit F